MNKLCIETYRKIFDNHGLQNIFLPIKEISNDPTEKWIYKSSEQIPELNDGY